MSTELCQGLVGLDLRVLSVQMRPELILQALVHRLGFAVANGGSIDSVCEPETSVGSHQQYLIGGHQIICGYWRVRPVDLKLLG